MSAAVDPNAPVPMVGESLEDFLARQQQYFIPTSGLSQSMARAWLDLFAPNTGGSAPTGFAVK